MASLTDYFEKNGYKPKYFIGDRVFGHYNRIPFVGTVGNDRNKVGGDPNPEVTIHLDLPMQLTSGTTSFIIVKHKDIKQLLKSYDQS
jgi:hypothetical protein